MKVFALISGGKDSIFNIIKCLDQGHDLIALGNLYNIQEGTELEGVEKDSHMYQTVERNITLAEAEAMGKPIYRKQITGTPKIMNLEYQGNEEDKKGDEVEDLFLLIREAKIKHPEINAVSSGAIFSTYQKLRVENICNRLGLTLLAYLWEREQVGLLQEMIDYPIHAVLIKIASFG